MKCFFSIQMTEDLNNMIYIYAVLIVSLKYKVVSTIASMWIMKCPDRNVVLPIPFPMSLHLQISDTALAV